MIGLMLILYLLTNFLQMLLHLKLWSPKACVLHKLLN